MKKGLFLMLVLFSLLLSGCFDKGGQISDINTVSDDEVTDNILLSAFGTEPFWDLIISGNMATFFEMNMQDYENKIQIPVTVKVDEGNYYFQGQNLEGSFEERDCIDGGKGDMHYYTVNVTYQGDMVFEGCGDDDRGVKYSDDELYEEKTISGSAVDLSGIEGFVKNCEKASPYWNDRSLLIENISFSWNSKMNIGKSYRVEGIMNYTADGIVHSDNVACIFTSDDVGDVWGNGEDVYGSYLRYYGKSDKELACIDGLDNYQPEWIDGDPQSIITVGCGPENYGNEYVTGYFYTSTYPDLGLRITTPAGFDSFYKKSDTPIFLRDGNRISYMYDGQEREYIQVYDKKASENIVDIIKKGLDEKCSVLEHNYYGQEKIFADYPGVIIYDIINGDGAIGKCSLNDGGYNEELDWRPVWFFESKDKTKYYKLVFTDGCAPGPCSMFGEIDLF